jgi:short-subunit dehydrogenase
MMAQKMTAIISDCGRGIGEENSKLLAKRGINVVVCSRTESDMNYVVQEIKQIAPDNYKDQR